MAKYGTGELVRFKASELLVSAGRGSIKIGTDGLVGKITGSVETTGEETKYYVEVKLPNGTFVGVSDVTLKLTVLESQIMTASEYASKVIDDMMKKAEEFKKRILPSDNPDPYSWLKSFLGPSSICCCGRIPKDLKPLRVTTEFSELLKKWEGERKHVPYAFYPLSSIEARFNNHFFGVDLGVAGGDKSATSVVDKKMSKSRCVKLLESYRAEREKVKKGRKFERCLRDSVVDEALERAIELLKGGTE